VVSDIIGPTFVAMIGQEIKILFFIILKLWNKILKTKNRIVFFLLNGSTIASHNPVALSRAK